MIRPSSLMTPPRLSLLAALLGAVVFASPARALNPQISKLYSRGGNTAAAEQFGDQVCITDRWILVGVPGYDLTVGGAAADDAGAVLVFDVKTGRYLRRLTANDSETDVAGDAFGSSVAVCGNRAVIGAPQFGGGQGAAYVFTHADGRWRQRARLVLADRPDVLERPPVPRR